ncbi:hypothetical protein [Ralstonia solanacearum]|uniref:hypothetical protein n=1 Tax=Ralstonia solanacearum TaxID=305 RepID=UPI0007C97882|nr:hypothetical protein [Ralstonia solanacearum]OAI76923.1 hypothetical protein RSP597_06470 [Ralstonia solanacearum]
MTRRKREADTIDAWGADVQQIVSRLDQLRAAVIESADIACMDLRPAYRELEAIASALPKIRSRLTSLKREAETNGERRQWKPGQPNTELANSFARRIGRTLSQE